MLGDTVKSYESGNSGVATVSGGVGDQFGGVSYGTYQLASKTGTVDRFVKQSIFAKDFQGLVPGTPKFTAQWKYLARTQTVALHKAEWEFIKKSHFDSARSYANELKLPSTPAIDEALWSMSIQHGKVKVIILNAWKSLPKEVTEEQIITSLYSAREQYIKGLKLPLQTKKSIIENRCNKEKLDVMTLLQS